MTLSPANTDKRRRPIVQKKRTARLRKARAARRRLQHDWLASAVAARDIGLPIDAQMTVLLGKDDIEDTTATIWRRLRRLFQRHGIAFLAMRAPEFARNRGHHLHLAMHLPQHLYGDVASILADVTGEPMARWFDVSGRRIGRDYGVVAIAGNGNWMLQRHVEGLGGSDEALVRYVAKADAKHKSIGRHQRSFDLTKLTSTRSG